MNPENIQIIQCKELEWVNITRIGQEEMKYLKEKYDFHPVHLADCLSPYQRPKLDVYQNYIFMVLLFPIYNKKTREIVSSEVDFFIGSNFLVTVHRNELPSLINFFNTCQVNEYKKLKYFTGNPSTLIYGILNELINTCSPIIECLNLMVRDIESGIFHGYEKRMVKEILIAKTNIINFKRIIQIHRSVLNKLLNKSERFFSTGSLQLYFRELGEMASDLWENLDNLNQSIDSIETTNNSLISFRLNDIMKILAVVSAIFLPINLIANLYGMLVPSVPFANHPLALLIVVSLMLLVGLFLGLLFRRKKWL